MRKMKKLFAMLLALVMVLGMTMTATAATAATITVDGVADGGSVTYKQVVTPDRANGQGWVFVEGCADAFIDAFGVATDAEAIGKLIALGALEDTDNYYAELGLTNNEDAALSSQFATAIDTITTSDDAAAPVAPATAWTISASTAGLYVINAEADGFSYIPMAAYVGYNDDQTALVGAEVVAKGSELKIEKVIDSEDNKSVSEGDIVGYTVTTEYPYYSADATAKTFTITDTLTNATYEAGTVVVKVNNTVVEEGADKDYTITPYADAKTFTITFNYDDSKAGKDVEVKYNVKVGAGEGDVVNAITTNFDPNGDSITLDKVQVTVTKVDSVDNNVKLDGATFKIYEAAAAAADGYTETPDVLAVEEAGQAAVTKTLYLKEIDTDVTDENGQIVFDGLDAQKTYYIKETNAPEGYSLNEEYYKLSPTEETTTQDSKVYAFENFADTTVKDTKLNRLPSTGGIGTTIFTVAGCMLMIGAAVLFFKNRRREA